MNQKINEIIWSLNTKNDTLESLVAYITKFSKKFLENTPIENYVYDVEKIYSGSGFISLMTAGNILSTNDDLLSIN